jgi:hypothetical protein
MQKKKSAFTVFDGQLMFSQEVKLRTVLIAPKVQGSQKRSLSGPPVRVCVTDLRNSVHIPLRLISIWVKFVPQI